MSSLVENPGQYQSPPPSRNNPVQLYLEKYREENGFTNSQVARVLGMHPPSTNRLINGDHLPSLRTFAVICTQLDIEPTQICKILNELTVYVVERDKKLYKLK